jgi:hypothetical protein
MICGKIIFTSRTEANAALKGANGKHSNEAKNRLNTSYFCNDCNGWHIASRLARMKKQKQPEEVSKHRKPREYSYLIIRNYTSKPL